MRFFVLVLSLLFSGCTLLVDTHLIPPIRLTLQKDEPIYTGSRFTCSKFSLPEMKPLPKPPTINATIAKDRKQTEAMLLDYIKSLKTLIREERLDIEEAFQQYSANCK